MPNKTPRKNSPQPQPQFHDYDDENRTGLYGRGSKEEAELTLDDLSSTNENLKYRICLLGIRRTGKSAYLKELSGKHFHRLHHYRPTRKEIRFRVNNFMITHDRYVDVMMHDFGLECKNYNELLTRAIDRAQGYIIFFSDDYPQSFAAVKWFANKIMEQKDLKDQSIAVVGLRTEDWRNRRVTDPEVKVWVNHWCTTHGCTMDYFCYTADGQGYNVDDILRYVISAAMIRNNIMMGNPQNPEEIPKQSPANKAMQRVQRVFKRANCTSADGAD